MEMFCAGKIHPLCAALGKLIASVWAILQYQLQLTERRKQATLVAEPAWQ